MMFGDWYCEPCSTTVLEPLYTTVLEPLYFGVVHWDRPSASSSLSAGLPSILCSLRSWSLKVALGSECSIRLPLFDCREGSVFAREEVRQEAVGIAPTNAVGAPQDAAVVKEAPKTGSCALPINSVLPICNTGGFKCYKAVKLHYYGVA
ncbi:hypothetical protein HaLaN_18804 [Haematococcus lacustris]|uniref:Uncharacterized protein n=1 Tax=Haematococcus lacustris TaxID=44745 RepID=A0A699ZPC3_HAELA|nr:hypothetical protein HaLaN_18804 [Haematococcus lacustris]